MIPLTPQKILAYIMMGGLDKEVGQENVYIYVMVYIVHILVYILVYM